MFTGIRSATAMKQKANKSSESRELLTTERLCEIWQKVRTDSDARKALNDLDNAGFRISHLKPSDATFMRPNWADYVAALPLLPNTPSTRRIHLKTEFRNYRPLVQELRQFVAEWDAPFVEVKVFHSQHDSVDAISTFRKDLLQAAATLDHFLSCDYYVRSVNQRNQLIAELRWTIREKTGKPHDRELSVLIDAAFRAAGREEGLYIDSTTLDRIEKRAKETRVKANRRIRNLIKTRAPSFPHSTRNR
jgi:hypothetical protein